MKRILLLLTLGLSAVHADVTLNDNGTVSVNGVAAGNASDALANKLISSADFMTALNDKLAATAAAVAAAQADTATLTAAMTTRLNADLSAYQAALATATDPTQRAVLAAQIALVQSYITQAGMSPAQIQAAALQASIAAQQAQLAKLQGN